MNKSQKTQGKTGKKQVRPVRTQGKLKQFRTNLKGKKKGGQGISPLNRATVKKVNTHIVVL